MCTMKNCAYISNPAPMTDHYFASRGTERKVAVRNIGVICIQGSVFFFKQKTAYEISTRDWSSDGVLFRSICSWRTPILTRERNQSSDVSSAMSRICSPKVKSQRIALARKRSSRKPGWTGTPDRREFFV